MKALSISFSENCRPKFAKNLRNLCWRVLNTAVADKRSRLCETLSPYLATERSDVSYGKLSGLLGISEAGVKRQLYNLRRRYRWLIWAEVAETVEDPGEVKSEIRHLCATLTAQAA